MARANVARSLPGFGALVVTALAPYASWQTLWVFSSADSRIKQVLDDPLTRAVMDLYLQFASLFIGLLVAVITAIAYLATSEQRRRGEKAVYVGCLIVGSALFVYVFLMGGAASLLLDYYIHQGSFNLRLGVHVIPSFRSLLTWFRIIASVLGLILGVCELFFWRGRGESSRSSGN